MLTKDLEAKIVSAIEAAIPSSAPNHVVFGAWQPSAAGVVKNTETDDNVAVVAVTTSVFNRETFTSPTGYFSGAVTLAVRTELDPTGSALVTFADAIDSLFRAWQGATYQQAFTELDVSGFSAGDISVSGLTPALDRTAALTSVSWNFTIRGTETAS